MQLGVKNPGVNSTVLFNGHINTRHPTLPAQGKRKKRRCENDIPIAWINKADSAHGVATREVILSARKVVPCVRLPAAGITAHIL